MYLCKAAKLLTQNAADQSSIVSIFYGISNFYKCQCGNTLIYNAGIEE